jgi:hypothetical protein
MLPQMIPGLMHLRQVNVYRPTALYTLIWGGKDHTPGQQPPKQKVLEHARDLRPQDVPPTHRVPLSVHFPYFGFGLSVAQTATVGRYQPEGKASRTATYTANESWIILNSRQKYVPATHTRFSVPDQNCTRYGIVMFLEVPWP